MFENSHAGLCAICFEPVRKGEEVKIKDNGRTYHNNCIKHFPNSYYVRKERKEVL